MKNNSNVTLSVAAFAQNAGFERFPTPVNARVLRERGYGGILLFFAFW